MTTRQLSEQQLQELLEGEASPEAAPFFKAIRAEADLAGGFTLEVWRLCLGHLWGGDTLRTYDTVAAELGVSVEKVKSEINAVIAKVPTSPQR